MTTFREKYDFWTDRQVGEHIYRYGSFDIKRCRADDPARHFHLWDEFETTTACIRMWQKICDQAAAETVGRVISPGATKDPA